MADETVPAVTAKPIEILPSDPDNVPVRTVNLAVSNIIGGVVAVTLLTDRIGFRDDGSARIDMVVAARLRFDLQMAKVIRDQLNAQIAMLEKPEGQAN